MMEGLFHSKQSVLGSSLMRCGLAPKHTPIGRAHSSHNKPANAKACVLRPIGHSLKAKAKGVSQLVGRGFRVKKLTLPRPAPSLMWIVKSRVGTSLSSVGAAEGSLAQPVEPLDAPLQNS